MRDKRTAGALVLLAAAITVAFERRVFPHGSSWIIFLVLLWAGGTLLARSWKSQNGGEEADRPKVRPLKPGESYDRPVKLATVPNAPIAELWLQRLRQEGIEAFCRGSLLRNPSLPVTLWVGEHDMDSARRLFPELQ